MPKCRIVHIAEPCRALLLATAFFLVFSGLAVAGNAERVAQGEAALEREEFAKAYELLMPEAEGGNARAQLLIGLLYQNGHHVDRDEDKAAAWLEKSIHSGSPLAKHFLASLYCSQGEYEKGLQLFQSSVEDGTLYDLYEVGVLYYKGQGAERDPCKAYEYFQRSIDSNDFRSAFYIALIYIKKECETVDGKNIVRYLLQASDRDEPQAQYALGLFFEYGYLVKADKVAAMDWYWKSSVNGYELASLRYQKLKGEGVSRLRTSPR